MCLISSEIFQVFSSQATDELQELIFKVAIVDAVNHLEYKIDFLHKVGWLPVTNHNVTEMTYLKPFSDNIVG